MGESGKTLVEDGLAKVGEASQFLGLSRSQIYKLMSQGDLPWVKIGTSRRVPRRALVNLAASGLVAAAAKQ
jgi:excisionase family DNA binding protein